MDGNYTLRVDGSQNGGERYGFLFENETVLMFHPKRVSVFIQTDKAFYQKRETGMRSYIHQKVNEKQQYRISAERHCLLADRTPNT